MTVNRILALVAVVLFAVCALGITSLGPVALLPAGLCFLAAAHLV